MMSQWNCLLKNLGQWEGSFTRFSPEGNLLKDIPSMVSLQGLDDNKRVRQIVRYFPPNESPQEAILEYSSLNRSTLFFENGSFSQGSMQWGPFSEFGAELGLIDGNRRLRLVQQYNKEGNFSQLTLIREKLAGTDEPEHPPLTVDQLIGEWKGEGITLYPDWRWDTHPTHLKIDQPSPSQLCPQFIVGDRIIPLTATIDGSRLHFENNEFPVQVLLLPDGASCNCPLTIKPRRNFVLEVGWLLTPTRRQRLVRHYNDKGTWVSLTLVTEEKI